MNFVKLLLKISLILWGLLTLIVIVFLFSRWTNPQTKGISDQDVKDYWHFSVWLIGFSIVLILILMGSKNRRKN